MHKRLFKCGNGMALIIDAHHRRVLGLDANTLLHVVREGPRIVIQKSACDQLPQTEPVIATPTTYHPRLLVKLLMDMDRAGLDRARFKRLSAGDRELFTLHADVEFGEPIEAVIVARLKACFDKLTFGLNWDNAIAEVVTEIPDDPDRSMLVPGS